MNVGDRRTRGCDDRSRRTWGRQQKSEPHTVIYRRSSKGCDRNYSPRPSKQKKGGSFKSRYQNRQRDSRHISQTGFIPGSNEPSTIEDTLTSIEKKEPSEIIQELLSEGSTLKGWLTEVRQRPDILPLLVSVLRKAFSCKFLPCKTADLFKVTLETDFFNTLTLYLVDLQSKGEFEKYKANGSDTFIGNILAIMLEIISRNPSSLDKIIRLKFVLGSLIEQVTQAGGFKDETIEQWYINLNKRTRSCNEIKSLTRKQGSDCPPDDFREIEIFPVKSDLQSTLGPFIRENKTKGSYDDLDHYLDVQFRLLREDFIGPLRDGVNEYNRGIKQEGRRKKLFSNVKIYERVKFVSPVCLDEGLCYKIQLDTSRLKRISWTKSKRLIYGSLLCLSSDNFDTFLIATVANRNIEEIMSGQLIIRFEGFDNHMTTKEIFSKNFTMAETTAYFESYRHVLSGLQTFRDGDLPFERYLVKCHSDVRPPVYLSEDTLFDFEPLLQESDVTGHYFHQLPVFNLEQCLFNVLDTNNWPSPERLGLDESQYNALKSALTREFSLIQGPPGTGKTYIGWKIANILLHNRFKLTTKRYLLKPKPMLIVCYTNHALDQFLEGIVNFFDGNILRVGGQSKSHLLHEFTMKRLKKKCLYTPKLRAVLVEEMNEITHSINTTNAEIDVYRSHVLKLEFLKPYIPDEVFRVLMGKNEGISKWLDMKTVLSRHETDTDESQKLANDCNLETQDIINMTNNRWHYDEDSELLNKKRYEERQRIMQNLRHEVVDMYFEEEIAPRDITGIRWAELRKRNMQANQIIKNNICVQDIMTKEEANNVINPWKLTLVNRWRLYRLWVKRLCESQNQKIVSLRKSFEDISAQYKEAKLQEDSHVMRQADVIGMTTTCAARYLPLLQDIGPTVVIVEEAAEVLEAHIITTLSKSCQHLILIGDHKQLRPSPSVYALASKFHLDLSLFERMILNGIPFNSLELQHRMKPEISHLMRHIYDNLRNHESVYLFESIRGVSHNIFFIKHDNSEERDDDSTSYSNSFEAEYVSKLCKYLLLQGYSPSSITILATYASQMFLLRRFMPKTEYEGVTISVVDNYQGEENDIVILSLVRSNSAGNIGFLKKENRVCVALSRAKKGLFVIGDFNLLASKSELWKKITEDMEKAGKIGDGIALYCQNHPKEKPLIAKVPKDFRDAPEGGCRKICGIRLPCGHSCKMFCHPVEERHAVYTCHEMCSKSCFRNHPCQKKCYEDCGDCPTIVKKELSGCGHVVSMPCGKDEYLYHCKEPCSLPLPCGHICQNDCGSSHTQNCKEEISKTFLCGHTADVECGSSEAAKCKHLCSTILNCGHACSGTCSDCCNGRFHHPCRKKCGRILVCGHECRENCNICLPCTRKCENKCVHSHCDKLCGEPCTPCMEKCAWQCPHKKCTKLCSEICDRGPCNEWCNKKLPCKHYCIGLCGEPCPLQCAVCDRDEVTTILFGNEDDPNARFILLEDCGHIIESNALDKYMGTSIERVESFVQLKGCPLCKVPIRTSNRYRNIINKTLADIEDVKRAIVGDEKQNRCIFKKLRERVNHNFPNKRSVDQLCKHRILSEQRLISFQNQCTLLDNLKGKMDVRARYTAYLESLRSSDTQTDFPYRYKDDDIVLTKIEERLSKKFLILTDHETKQIKTELARCDLMNKLFKLQDSIPANKIEQAKEDIELLKKESRQVLIDSDSTIINKATERLKKLTEGINISDEEKKMVLKTMGLKKGHWYKCPNGK